MDLCHIVYVHETETAHKNSFSRTLTRTHTKSHFRFVNLNEKEVTITWTKLCFCVWFLFKHTKETEKNYLLCMVHANVHTLITIHVIPIKRLMIWGYWTAQQMRNRNTVQHEYVCSVYICFRTSFYQTKQKLLSLLLLQNLIKLFIIRMCN